jgi:hypothetical protein
LAGVVLVLIPVLLLLLLEPLVKPIENDQERPLKREVLLCPEGVNEKWI